MNKSSLFINTCIVTPDSLGNVQSMENAHIAVDQGLISYVGTSLDEARRSLSDPSSSEIFECRNKLIMPTFANGHSHLPMTLLKNSADDLPLEDWLFNHILPREDHLTPDDIYYGSLLGIAEMIQSGIGATADMYFMAENTVRAASESGFRINLCHDGKYKKDDRWFTDEKGFSDFVKELSSFDSEMIRLSLMVHSIYLYPEYMYPQLADMAKALDTSIHVHISETRVEVENAIRNYGRTPVEALRDFGILDRPCIGAHGVHLSDSDRIILAEKNVTIAHNPSSNMKLASGLCDVRSLIEAGVNVSLGTDGSASNNNLNMFQEIRLASFIAKIICNDASSLNAKEIINMSTRAGYRSMGFMRSGTLEVGMNADLQVIDLLNPSIWPVGQPESAIVYSATPSCVESVMVAGKFLKYKNDMTTIDLDKIRHETMARSKRITCV